jgi:hypothetical protein
MTLFCSHVHPHAELAPRRRKKGDETKKKEKRMWFVFPMVYGRFLNNISIVAMTIIINTMSPAETGRK